MATQTSQHKTLLILFWNLGIGGVQTKIVDIAKHVTDKSYGISSCHIVLREAPEFRLDAHIPKKTASIHYRPSFLGDSVHIPFTLYTLYETIRINPDIILTYLDHASFIAIIISKILFWRHIRVVINEDTLTSGHTTSYLKRMLLTLLYPHADVIISPTEASKRDLTQHYSIPNERITPVPNWTLHRPKPSGTRAPKRIDLLYVGRFDTQKNLLFLLQTVRILIHTKPRITVVLVGEGRLREKLALYIRKHHLSANVSIHKSTPDIDTYLQNTKLCVTTSHYEGMPVALLEAMAAGVPIVAKQYPGLTEYLTHNTTGYITQTKRGLAKGIIHLLADKRARIRMGEAARNAARTKFGKQTLHRYIRLVVD